MTMDQTVGKTKSVLKVYANEGFTGVLQQTTLRKLNYLNNKVYILRRRFHWGMLTEALTHYDLHDHKIYIFFKRACYVEH